MFLVTRNRSSRSGRDKAQRNLKATLKPLETRNGVFVTTLTLRGGKRKLKTFWEQKAFEKMKKKGLKGITILGKRAR